MRRAALMLLMLASVPIAAQPRGAFIPGTSGALARFDGRTWVEVCGPPPAGPALRPSPVRRVPSDTSEWRAVAPVVERTFEQEERRQRLASARTGAPVRIDALFASQAAQPTYYFEASRWVEDRAVGSDVATDPPGVLRIDVWGWLQQVNGVLSRAGADGSFTWEQSDRTAPRVAAFVPVGTVVDGTLWVMQEGGGHALYGVSGGRARMVLRTAPRC
jgi:hypothetical protein